MIFSLEEIGCGQSRPIPFEWAPGMRRPLKIINIYSDRPKGNLQFFIPVVDDLLRALVQTPAVVNSSMRIPS